MSEFSSEPLAKELVKMQKTIMEDLEYKLATITKGRDEYKKALEEACVEIAQLNIIGKYIRITNKVMPDYWLAQVRGEDFRGDR